MTMSATMKEIISKLAQGICLTNLEIYKIASKHNDKEMYQWMCDSKYILFRDVVDREKMEEIRSGKLFQLQALAYGGSGRLATDIRLLSKLAN